MEKGQNIYFIKIGFFDRTKLKEFQEKVATFCQDDIPPVKGKSNFHHPPHLTFSNFLSRGVVIFNRKNNLFESEFPVR